jgi:hypothetical protein
MTTSPTEEAYEVIANSSIFRTDGPNIDLSAALLILCGAIRAEDETDWTIGEHSVPLDAVIVGAYWTLTEWHGGQATEEYAALSQLGRIYSPGPITNGPQPETSEEDAYRAFCEYYAAKN